MADAPLQLFTYKIVYKHSESIETIIASSQDIAWVAVKRQDSNSISLIPNRFWDNFKSKLSSSRNIRVQDYLSFYRNMNKCLLTGASLKDALTLSALSVVNPFFRGILGDLILKVTKRGLALSEALESYRHYFGDHTLVLIKAAEVGGRLHWAFGELAKETQQRSALQGKIKSSLVYPMILLSFAVIAVVIISVFSLPKIIENFKAFDANLPSLTLKFMSVIAFLKAKGWLLLLAAVAFINLFLKIKKMSLKDAVIDTFDRIPIIKSITIGAKLAKSLKTIATLMEANIHVDAIYGYARQVSNSKLLSEYFNAIHLKIKRGVSPEEAFYQESYKLGKLGKMIATELQIAKFCGEREKIINRVSETIYLEVALKAEAMTKLVEPLMLIPISGFIGFLMLIVYLPTFELMLNILKN